MPNAATAARIPALDGLRGIAIALVLLCHLLAQLESQPGLFHYAVVAGRLSWSGVDLFFVLSGFLIGGILLDANHSPRYYSTFYARRAFRILPIYGIVLGLCALRYLPFHWLPRSLGAFSAVEIPWIAYFTFTQNFWMARIGNLGLGTLSPTWSLAVEEQFYLTIPAVLRRFSRRRLMFLLIAVVLAVPLLRAAVFHYYRHAAVACYVLMPCRADALSLGVLSALLVRNGRCWRILCAHRKWLQGAAAILLVALAVFTWREPSLFGSWLSLQYSVLGLFYSLCLLIALSRTKGAIHTVLTTPVLRKLGIIAYFMYLFHIPIIEAARRAVTAHVTQPTAAHNVFLSYSLGLGTTLLLASISWVCLERPLIRRARAFTY